MAAYVHVRPSLHVATYYAYTPTPRRLFGLPFVHNLATEATLTRLPEWRRQRNLDERRRRFWVDKVEALHAHAARLPPHDLVLFFDADVVATAVHSLGRLRRVSLELLRNASTPLTLLVFCLSPLRRSLPT